MPSSSVDPKVLAAVRTVQWHQRRILGAVAFIDRTLEIPVTTPLIVHIPNATLLRNRSGRYVIHRAVGFDEHVASFRAPPDEPPLEDRSFLATVEDPTGRYLARSFSVSLPRDPDPNHADDGDSLFQPVYVRLFPAPALPFLRPLWSVVRVSLCGYQKGRRQPMAGALVRVTDVAGSLLLGSGMTDRRGEGIVPVAGIPYARSSEGGGDGNGGGDEDAEPVLLYETPARLQLVWDPEAEDPPDPDRLERNHASFVRHDESLSLKAGRTQKVQRTVFIA